MLLGMAGLVNAQKLRFNEAGEFKIIQFTDMHIDYKHGYNDPVFDLVAEISDETKSAFINPCNNLRGSLYPFYFILYPLSFFLKCLESPHSP